MSLFIRIFAVASLVATGLLSGQAQQVPAPAPTSTTTTAPPAAPMATAAAPTAAAAADTAKANPKPEFLATWGCVSNWTKNYAKQAKY